MVVFCVDVHQAFRSAEALVGKRATYQIHRDRVGRLHRIKRTPFQQAEMTTEQLQERIEQLAGQSMPSEEDEESESQQADGEKEEKKT